jgi:hypothetical protein
MLRGDEARRILITQSLITPLLKKVIDDLCELRPTALASFRLQIPLYV